MRLDTRGHIIDSKRYLFIDVSPDRLLLILPVLLKLLLQLHYPRQLIDPVLTRLLLQLHLHHSLTKLVERVVHIHCHGRGECRLVQGVVAGLVEEGALQRVS